MGIYALDEKRQDAGAPRIKRDHPSKASAAFLRTDAVRNIDIQIRSDCGNFTEAAGEMDRIAREVPTNPVIEEVQFQARELNHFSEAPAQSLTKRRDQPYYLLHGTPL